MAYERVLSSDGNYYNIVVEPELTEENCSPEFWAYLHAPDDEKKLSTQEWHELYHKRLAEDPNYPFVKPIDDSDLPF